MNNTTDPTNFESPPTNVWGIVVVCLFYLAILLIGIYASWRSKMFKGDDSERLMVADRNLGALIGVFTMTATWVGGGYINGTAEIVYTPGYGLVWAQAPVGYSLALTLAGIFFAKKMRDQGYVTMMDPFNNKYGVIMTTFLYLPALLGDLFWSAAILAALGASLSVILNLTRTISIIVSACISVTYTLVGGLYSVVLTDVVQLICIFIGLWLGVGFALNHDAVTPLSETKSEWLGSLAPDAGLGLFIDSYLLLIFGGIPWQVYFQRVLASKTARRAQILSICASFGCLIMAVPAVMLGAIGASARWNETDYVKYYPLPIPAEKYGLILPLVLQYLCPKVVAVIGLGAVSAAVMSSTDSSVLSASSMFSRNIYTPLRNLISRSEASQKEIVWVMRVAILVVGALACVIAIEVNSIYGLFVLCGDLVYVLLFPQLTCVVYFPYANTYGSAAGFLMGAILRLLGGEPLLGMAAALKYPYYSCTDPADSSTCVQNFPFKTLAMLVGFVCILIFSSLTHWLFSSGNLSEDYDVFGVFKDSYDLTQKGAPLKFLERSQEKGNVNEAYLPDPYKQSNDKEED